MTLQEIRKIEVQKIISETTTIGSSPLQVLADDMNYYYAKTTTPQVPRVELINELLCAYFAQCWDLKVPPFALVTISDIVIKNYISEKGNLSSRYESTSFGDNLFFASQIIEPVIELEKYLLTNQQSLKTFHKPQDLIKIGVFDFWIGNKDRQPSNPNVLISGVGQKFNFHPIDHTAAFAYLTDYKKVIDILLSIEPKNNILSSPIVCYISNFVGAEAYGDLKEEILGGIEVVLQSIDFIFEQVPSSWGFSKKQKAHLKQFLSDKERNERIVNSYLK
jgi:hypothetical protein